MGTTAEKLTYLNETKSKIKDNINLTGAGLTNQTPFRQYATDLKTALLNILNNGIDTLYNNFPKTTGTGTNITLNNTLQAPMRSVINGDTEQDSYSGKNKFGKALFDTTKWIVTGTDDEFSVQAINSGTTQQEIPLSFESGCHFNGTIEYTTLNGSIQLRDGSTNRKTLLSIFDNTSGISNINESAGVTDNLRITIYNTASKLTFKKCQLESGSSATSYEPYVGGQPSPSPDYPQEIKSVTGLQKVKVEGKNLFDKNDANVLNCLVNGTNGAITTNNNCRTLYIPIKNNTTYTISKILSSRFVIGTSSSVPSNGTSCNVYQQNNTATNITITSSANDNYLCVFYYLSTADTLTEQQILDSIQIEYGSATTYEPYQSQEYEINLGKNLLNESLISNTNRGLTWNYTDNKININGTTTSTYSQSNKINLTLPIGTYVFSKSTTSTASFGIWLYNQNNTLIATGTPNNAITINEEVKSFALYVEGLSSNTQYNIDINVMLEKGSTPTSYSPYFTPIHLYENDQIIGTPNNWSIKHVMGEVVLDGSENWNMLGSVYNYFQYTPTNLNQNTSDANPMSNYFIKNTAWNERKQGIWFDRNLIIKTNESLNLTQSLSDFKTWLSTHNTKVVYELATPTTEPITNTELIEDLNNFYNAKSYNGQTNISVEGDLQMILDVSALKGEE